MADSDSATDVVTGTQPESQSQSDSQSDSQTESQPQSPTPNQTQVELTQTTETAYQSEPTESESLIATAAQFDIFQTNNVDVLRSSPPPPPYSESNAIPNPNPNPNPNSLPANSEPFRGFFSNSRNVAIHGGTFRIIHGDVHVTNFNDGSSGFYSNNRDNSYPMRAHEGYTRNINDLVAHTHAFSISARHVNQGNVARPRGGRRREMNNCAVNIPGSTMKMTMTTTAPLNWVVNPDDIHDTLLTEFQEIMRQLENIFEYVNSRRFSLTIQSYLEYRAWSSFAGDILFVFVVQGLVAIMEPVKMAWI
ncbi:hypothetical protein BDN70DRAFT_993163 [Pholiota conissans]|uniref:Uncharacterized protein n=1 Tax=Pholiota conissans TaxID=109636 RepID=A0A9P6CTY5_9AGAR|nr:hypothetical protein BDN70DRAFT_993163 [Pholiota conissans]